MTLNDTWMQLFNPQVYAGGTCDNGVRTVSSAAPFAVTAYGWLPQPFATFADALPGSYAYTPLTAHGTVQAGDGGVH